MARIQGLKLEKSSWPTRILYYFTRRSLGALTGKKSLPEAVPIVAHQPGLLRAVSHMEVAQAGSETVDKRLKCLASLRASSLTGCPF